MTKLYSNNDEIIIDLTSRNYSTSDTFSIIEIIDVSYMVPVIEGITKRTYLMGNYRLNLYYLQCTCPAYKNSLKIYPKRDIRRICKHLYFKLVTTTALGDDSLVKMLLDNRFWLLEKDLLKLRLDNELIYIGFSDSTEMVGVYRYHSSWKRFSFNLLLRNWTNGLMPFKEVELNGTLEKFIVQMKAVEQRRDIISNFRPACELK